MAADRFSPLDKLRIADPDTYVRVKGRLALISPSPSDEVVSSLTDATIWGLSQEGGMGEALAEGLLRIVANGSDKALGQYIQLVRKAAETGPTLGRIMATFLAPVLLAGDPLLVQFQETVGMMQRKGTYTLTAPLEALSDILSLGDVDAASVYLELLAAVFSQDITYNQSVRLVYLIPKAVSGFKRKRRKTQIRQLQKVAQANLKLVDPFLDGLEKGTGLLDEVALETFVGQALDRYAQAPELGIKFLSLSSKVGKDTCAALGRAVPLLRVRAQINRYLHARMGRPVTVKPLSEMAMGNNNIAWVCSDGRHIFLPDEIDEHPTQIENETLYKSLSRLEAGFFECRTFDFDLEKAMDRYPEVKQRIGDVTHEMTSAPFFDGERFVASFHPEILAVDLFDLFELARVSLHLRWRYPGLVRQIMPIIYLKSKENDGFDEDHVLAPVFLELVLGKRSSTSPKNDTGILQHQLIEMFRAEIDRESPVEATAQLVCLAFDRIQQKLRQKINRYIPMVFPFDRRLHWDIIGQAHALEQQTALRIKMRLKEKGLDVYRSDLRNRLSEQQGFLTGEDIVELVLVRSQNITPEAPAVDPSDIDLADIDLETLLRNSGAQITTPSESNRDACIYPEWALHLNDYLYRHTRVLEIEVPGDEDGAFYNQTLIQHSGLVANMRRAFELLKPEGLAMLRQWPEGDAFDYRALLDFAMDRRAGRIPSDRLFIKRLKQERDVAVLLLVDLSRSTANPVSGGHTTVLDVTKQALVLFCEALQVVGDNFAIAGFSGTGRHQVDFFRIKGFAEAFSNTVRSRISALRAHRSTRMGAAIRHAAALLDQADARVRLMILVSDGFPNDIGYKSDYAIADTRRAIQEARSRNFHVKAITVNIGSDPRLDDLYGRNHHHVIGDVRELPDKLVRLYGALTRF